MAVDPPRLILEPIGFVRSPLRTKAEAARQPRAAQGVAGTIELLPGRHYEHALADLPGWEYLWITFWFHLNEGWRPKVLPPRSRTGRKGVFATRSPHRPNPLGLSVVRLERVEGLVLHVGGLDLLDGTPVLDIKPYVAYTDAIPQARSGWLDDGAAGAGTIAGTIAGATQPADPIDDWQVLVGPLAQEQFDWVEARAGLALGARAREVLRLGPEPHPYRRIRRTGGRLVLAVKEWRVHARVEGRVIHVDSVASGYRPAQLAGAGPADALLQAHREFTARFAAPAPFP